MLSLIEKVILTIIIVVGVYLSFKAFYIRYLLVKKGQPDERTNNWPKRLWYAIVHVFCQRCTLRDRPWTGMLHFFVFWGFVFFALVTINHVLSGYSEHLYIFRGGFGKVYTNIVDLIALLVLFGILGLAFRRYVLRPPSLLHPPEDSGVIVHPRGKERPQLESTIVILLISGLMISYLLMEGFGISLGIEEQKPFFGQFLASFLPPSMVGFKVFWWTHIVLILTFLVFIPNSKHLHLVTGPFNAFFKYDKPSGKLTTLDLENAEFFGASKLEQLSWKRLYDSFTCIECGRCQDVCPAYASGKPLSPKWIILNIQFNLLDEKDNLLKKGESERQLVGTVVSEDGLWSCTTCGACFHHCPMSNEHMFDIIDMRRYMVLEESKFPSEITTAFKNFEVASNPWGIDNGTRGDWAKGLDVPLMSEKGRAEYLLFVGCMASFDETTKKTAIALAKILNKAGIDYAILGPEEMCCGDSARRLGNEYLYQMLAMQNIETFNNYGVKKIITICPHGYNTIKNEYPDFGGNYEVYHYTEIIEKLLKEGKIKLKKEHRGKITFHDPCYLGRHNGVYDAPRDVLTSIKGVQLVEMEKNRENSFCCGAGGGSMWFEVNIGQRLNVMRMEQAMETGAREVAVACPFCYAMFDDAAKVKGVEEEVKVRDIAQLVAEAMED